MPVSTSEQPGPGATAPLRSVVRSSSSGAKWCTPSGTPSTPAHTAYTSTGWRFPADIAVRKYVGSSNAGDALVRVTPAVKNSRRASMAAAKPAGLAGPNRALHPAGAPAPDPPHTLGDGVALGPTYRI